MPVRPINSFKLSKENVMNKYLSNKLCQIIVKTIIGIISSATIATYAIAAPVRWDISVGGNGHWYDLVFESRNWEQARVAAESYTILGTQGYLATITSAEENKFLLDNFLSNQTGKGFWLGGYQLPGQTNTDEGWQWVTGEKWDYTNWWLGNVVPEPNDWPGMGVEDGQEDYMGFSHESLGQWNDTRIDEPFMSYGYFVEVNPAPIPASLWLFISGVFGLLGYMKPNRIKT